jgi:hypothetical protein
MVDVIDLRAVLFAIAVMCAPQAVAIAGPFSGMDLLGACQQMDDATKEELTPSNAVDGGLCLGFFTAVDWSIVQSQIDYPVANPNARGYTFNDVCWPKGTVTLGQEIKVWVKWANEHPSDLHLSAYSLLLAAYAQAWPCVPAISTPPGG